MHSQKMTLRRIDPMSVAKIAGVLYALIGLVAGAFISLIFVIGGLAGAAARQPVPPMFGILFGAGAIIFLPVFYGVLGFIGVLLSAMLYNWLAAKIGGMQWILDVSPASDPSVLGS